MKKIIKFSIPIVSSIFPSLLASCSNDNGFYFANFQSYISDSLLNRLQSNSEKGIDNKSTIKNFNYRTFSTNEDLERNFYTNYDVAVPSTYLAVKLANEGELKVIDWSKFHLHKLDKYGNKTNDMIENAEDALTLFTPQVRATLLSYDLTDAEKIIEKYPDEEKIYKKDGGLLNFCVPYFLQNLGLTYKSKDGKEWNFDNKNNDNLSWPTIMNVLRQKINDGSIKKIAATDDSRILYSVARLIQTSSNSTGPYVNPGEKIDSNTKSTTLNKTISIDDFENTFKYLTNGIKKNTYYLNSDSNILLNLFAYPNSGSADAIFSYNGDTLYGSQGGDSYGYNEDDPSVFEKWILNYFNGDDFKIKTINPQNSFLLLDTMVINRKRVLEKNHLDLAYDVIYKIGLEGADHSLYNDNTKSSYNNDASVDNDPIFTVNSDDEFKYGPMLNFSYVQYVSPLQTINSYVLNTSSKLDKYQATKDYNGVPNFVKNNLKENNDTSSSSLGSLWDSVSTKVNGNGFYTNLYNKDKIIKSSTNPNGFLNEKQYNNFINTLIDIYSINKEINPNNIARNISDLNKSNMSWAYTNMKELYF